MTKSKTLVPKVRLPSILLPIFGGSTATSIKYWFTFVAHSHLDQKSDGANRFAESEHDAGFEGSRGEEISDECQISQGVSSLLLLTRSEGLLWDQSDSVTDSNFFRQNPTRKMYILVGIAPSVDITGGPWFTDNELDVEFIDQLKSQTEFFLTKRVCLNFGSSFFSSSARILFL